LELLFSAEQGKLSLGSLPAIGDQSNREEHQPANHPAQIGGLEFLTNNLGDCNIGHFHPDLTCDYYSTHTGGVKPDTKAGSQKLLEGIAITSCDLKHNPEIEEIVLSNFSVQSHCTKGRESHRYTICYPSSPTQSRPRACCLVSNTWQEKHTAHKGAKNALKF